MDNEKIKELEEEIRKLLEERPDLQPLQDKIDKIRNSEESTHNKNTKLQHMLLETWSEIIPCVTDFEEYKKKKKFKKKLELVNTKHKKTLELLED